MEKEMITFSKDKIVLLSKLMKEIKNVYAEQKGKELLIYKYRVQRKLLESMLDEKAINKYITTIKENLNKEELKKQIKQEHIC